MVWLLAQVEGDNEGGASLSRRPAGMLVVASLILVCDVGEWGYFLLQGKSSRALGVSTPPT